MAQRKAYPLRLDPAVYEELQRWADAELRSVNSQIEFLLRRALQDAGRLPEHAAKEASHGAKHSRKS
ncbi:MAG TPA: hypothetical protein VFL57_04435 [Bryobacteraceae bacterium]|nr:hypothetical protein [Bryobacteraceae bacterium]